MQPNTLSAMLSTYILTTHNPTKYTFCHVKRIYSHNPLGAPWLCVFWSETKKILCPYTLLALWMRNKHRDTQTSVSNWSLELRAAKAVKSLKVLKNHRCRSVCVRSYLLNHLRRDHCHFVQWKSAVIYCLQTCTSITEKDTFPVSVDIYFDKPRPVHQKIRSKGKTSCRQLIFMVT